jgi:L-idonate 5-dehydrogenase
MRAVVIHAPHDLRLDEMAEPTPGPGEVLVRIKAGGICGSDLHYYHEGGFGVVRIKQPLVLGHEIAGVVESVGSDVSHVVPGMRVAVNPSQPCNACRFCREGLHRHCLDMKFMGSAMRFPHVHGGFRECVAVSAAQAIPVADSLSLGEAAMAEPLAVCLHAARQAGPLQGKCVLVTGSGPIGLLSVLVARHAGAAEIVATDVASEPLVTARKIGASRAINVREEPQALESYHADKGHFDVMFEASGNQAAVVSALPALRPGGTIVQLGIGGDMTLPMNVIVAKEIQIRGTFRFDREFQLAVDLMGSGAIDVKPLISDTLPMARAKEAFDLASDKSRSIKVQIGFGAQGAAA